MCTDTRWHRGGGPPRMEKLHESSHAHATRASSSILHARLGEEFMSG